MKSTYISFVFVYGLFVLFVSIGSAANYTFTWDAPHPNDNVVEYRIYYRINSSTYDVDVFKQVLITNPKFDAANPVWKIELPYLAEEYCFTATAWDDDGFESDPSAGVGKGTTCDQKIFDDDIADDDGGGGGGGGGGGCFIWVNETK